MNAFMIQLLSLSVSGSLLVLLLLLLKKLYRNRLSKCWQYYILLAAALRFLLPSAPDAALAAALLQAPQLRAAFSMPAPGFAQPHPDKLSSRQPPAQQADAAAPARQADTSVSKPPAQQTTEQADSTHLPSGSAVLFLLWLVPALTLFLKKIKSYRGFVHHIRTCGTAVDDTGILNLLASCEEACKVKTPAELYCCPHLASPAMTGFFRPCIAIPDKSLPRQELELILLHELYHYRRRDLFYKWLVQIVVCIHWFHPFGYLLEKEVNHACELSCDEAVIRSLPAEGKKAYGDMLLHCSKAALFPKPRASSLTLTQDAKQLKERLGAIMRFQQPSKKTKLATAVLTAGICLGSAAIGAYASPSHPAQNPMQADGQAADSIITGYQELLALRTDSYQDQTVRQFRNQTAEKLDTPQGTALLEQALQDEALHLHRLDNADAFFLCNTLRLATGSWKKVSLEAAAVERPLKNGQFAELDFKASIKLNEPDIKVSEYEAAYRGLADTANAYLMSKTDKELTDPSRKSIRSLSNEAMAALKKYAKSINQKGNLTLKIYMCGYSPEGTAMRSHTAPKDSYTLPQEIQKVLTLKTNGYQDHTLKQFLDDIQKQYADEHSLWKARQRLETVLDEEAKQHLSIEDYRFLTTTLPCTESESTYPGDRVASLPPDFYDRYTLPYPKHGTKISLEWAVQYEIKDQTLTVGERDELIFHVKDKMEAFVNSTWESADIGTMDYLKKVRRHLNQLVKESSVPGLEMTVLHCLSDGRSA